MAQNPVRSCHSTWPNTFFALGLHRFTEGCVKPLALAMGIKAASFRVLTYTAPAGIMST